MTMKRRPLPDMLGGESTGKDAINLIETLLKFNPAQRLTAHAALRHPYVARFHNSSQVRVDSKDGSFNQNDATGE